MSKENGVKPTFDFTRVNRQWSRAFGATLVKASRAMVAMERPLSNEVDDAGVQAHYDRQDQAISELEQIAEEQAALVAQVIGDVPREWLVVSAPEEIDWSDPASLDYIQAPRYNEILEMLRNGQAMAQEDAKNSHGHTPSPQKRREASASTRKRSNGSKRQS